MQDRFEAAEESSINRVAPVTVTPLVLCHRCCKENAGSGTYAKTGPQQAFPGMAWLSASNVHAVAVVLYNEGLNTRCDWFTDKHLHSATRLLTTSGLAPLNL